MSAGWPWGALLGLIAGCGLLLVVIALTAPVSRRPNRRPAGAVGLLRAAGLPAARPSALVASCVGSALVGAAVGLLVTAILVVALVGGAGAACLPVLVLRGRAVRRRERLRVAWPEAVDTLASAVRAGLSLPEALADLGHVGPAVLRPPFIGFGNDYRATGSFASALDNLQQQLGDPVADRVVAALRLAREFGGTELGLVLRTLSAMLRDDARTRGEIQARQSWTVAAARMAVAAPWLTLALLCTRPEAAQAYATSGGAVVIAATALLSAVAYPLMLRIGRLPADERIA